MQDSWRFLCAIFTSIFHLRNFSYLINQKNSGIMTSQNIEDILKMRMSVYKAGVNAGLWNDIDQSGASDMMAYIFPKSGQIAYYNLVLELMRKEHSMLTGGSYFLFKLPVQVEKEIMEYLKHENIDFTSLVPVPEDYLKSMDTIVTDHGFTTVNIGSFNANEIDSALRLCASHYRYSFQNNVTSFPFFD